MNGLASAVLSVLPVIMLGWLAIRNGRTPGAVVEAWQSLGTLLTLVSGVFSAVWWHQSATLSDRIADQNAPDRQLQRDANLLNGAAATATALAVIAGLFSTLSPGSLEGRLAAGCFLLLVGVSGREIAAACRLSLRQELHPRLILGFAILILAVGLFLWRHVLATALSG